MGHPAEDAQVDHPAEDAHLLKMPETAILLALFQKSHCALPGYFTSTAFKF
jgi:hypothetical protein